MKLGVETLEDRICPTTVVYHGGEVLTSPQVENIYVNTPANFDGFSQTLVSNYAPLLNPYGIHGGSFLGGSFLGSISLSSPPNLSLAQLQSLLSQALATGQIPAPNPSLPNPHILYMVYLPQNVTDSIVQNDAGFHSSFQWNGYSIPYTVVFPALPGNFSLGETIAASHEFAEACTDPFANGWYGGNSYVNGEISDLYNGQSFFLNGFQVSEFALPSGSEYQPPFVFNLAELLAIPSEEFMALAWGFLAKIDPAFSPQALNAQTTLNTNPMLVSPYGWWAETLGEELFIQMWK